VINGSLSLQDFRKGQVPSLRQFKKLRGSAAHFQKSAQGEIVSIRGGLGNYLKSTDADGRFRKLSKPVVRGEGSPARARCSARRSCSGLRKPVGPLARAYRTG
jgi:hypothetical protein